VQAPGITESTIKGEADSDMDGAQAPASDSTTALGDRSTARAASRVVVRNHLVTPSNSDRRTPQEFAISHTDDP